MSDDLHRAIQERGNAFRPDRTPPFQRLRDCKRRRDQRRAGAAVALSVAAVLGVAVVPSALGSGGSGTSDLADQAGASAEYAYTINWRDNTDAYSDAVYEALTGRCLTLPGLGESAMSRSLPPGLSGRIKGADNADAFRKCAEEAAPGANVEVLEDLSEQPAHTAYTLRPALVRPMEPSIAQEIEQCLALPGVTGSSVQESDPPTYGITAREDAKRALEDCARNVPLYYLELAGRAERGDMTLAEMQALQARIGQDAHLLEAEGVDLAAWGPNAGRRQVNVGVASDLTLSDRVLRERYGDDIYVFVMNKAVSQRIGKDTDAVLADPTGVSICDTGESQDACRSLGQQEATALARVFNEAEAIQTTDILCRSLSDAWRVHFTHPSAMTIPVDVPKGCGPLMIGSQQYRLDPSLQQAVNEAYERSGPTS